MTPPSISASRPSLSVTSPQTPAAAVTKAKLDFIAAAYAASPLRVVEKHPMASVTATAAAAMAITVIGSSRMFSPAGVGILGKGVGLLGTLVRSNFGTMAMQAAMAKITGVHETPHPDPAAIDPNLNAVG